MWLSLPSSYGTTCGEPRDAGRLVAPPASSTVTLTVAPGVTGRVSRTTPSAPSKRPSRKRRGRAGLLDPCLVRTALVGATEPPDQRNRLIALTDDEHEPSGGGGERHPAPPSGLRARPRCSRAPSRAPYAGTGRARARIDERPGAEADRGEPGSHGEGGERRPARPPSRRRPQRVRRRRGRNAARRCGRQRARQRSTAGRSFMHRPRISAAPDDTDAPVASHPRPLARAGAQPGRAVGFVPMWPGRSEVQVDATNRPIGSRHNETIGATNRLGVPQIGASR